MRTLLFISAFGAGFIASGQKLVKQKNLKVSTEVAGEYVRYLSGNHVMYFSYTEFFDKSIESKWAAHYRQKETNSYYRVWLNDLDSLLTGDEKIDWLMASHRKIYALVEAGKVVIKEKGKAEHWNPAIKKLKVYIDKTMPPIAATRWVYTDKKKNVIWTFDEVSMGCPAF